MAIYILNIHEKVIKSIVRIKSINLLKKILNTQKIRQCTAKLILALMLSCLVSLVPVWCATCSIGGGRVISAMLSRLPHRRVCNFGNLRLIYQGQKLASRYVIRTERRGPMFCLGGIRSPHFERSFRTILSPPSMIRRQILNEMFLGIHFLEVTWSLRIVSHAKNFLLFYYLPFVRWQA